MYKIRVYMHTIRSNGENRTCIIASEKNNIPAQEDKNNLLRNCTILPYIAHAKDNI